MYNKALRTVFLAKLKEHNLTVYFSRNNYYILVKGTDSTRIVCVELICSTKIIPEVHGSHNNNITNGIGHFKFIIPKWEDKIHYYLLVFLDVETRNPEFVIVSDKVLRSRLEKLNRIPSNSKKAELTLWLMPDRKVYDCTNISIEGEWHFMSKGINGRMADNTEWDYTDCLNNWKGMIDAFNGQ